VPLLGFPLGGGVLLKQDLEKEVTDEQEDFDLRSKLTSSMAPIEHIFTFFAALAELKIELRKLAMRPPGEIGCFTFFNSP
jgi:hypothetical protein